MRIAIIHNSNAGEGEHSTEELAQHLFAAGHAVEVHGKTREDVVEALHAQPDLLMVAGGDGTVSRAVRTLFELGTEPRVPLLVLPVGTANNLARSLRIDGDAEALLRRMDHLEGVWLDIGRIVASWGTELFVESVGVGILGTILDGERSAAVRLTRAAREAVRPKDLRFEKRVEDFAREVERAKPRHLHIHADGEELSGLYIAAEVMNIRTIGPLVPLAPDADPGDGRFDLLLVDETERAALAEYVVRAGASGGLVGRPPGIRRRVKEVRLSWPEIGGHVDDRAWPDKREWTDGHVHVEMAGAIEVWRPQRAVRPE